MAASARAITPTHSGPFSVPTRPDTPGQLGNPHARAHNNGATFGTHLTKSPGGMSPRHSPQPLAHQQAERSRSASANPQAQALQSLIGLNQQMGQPRKDGVPETAVMMSAPLKEAAKSLVIDPQHVPSDGNLQTSPVSLESFGSNDALTSATTATALEPTAGPMQGQEGPGAPQNHHQQQEHVHQQHDQAHPYPHQHIAPAGENRAFTFPPPMPPDDHDPRAPTRQMSLPGYQNNTKSPGKTRHKCPYCATDFTRHHNLKSHLLTHSQEKPYECTTCQARFRRLHDLKRHTKLHTGERNHVCQKCGRKFARGDALARHSKGPGGCAGRRPSFPENDDDRKVDDSMDGVLYHGHDHDGEADDDDDASGRRVSEPARKRQNTGNSAAGPYHQHHSSTYPPLAANHSRHAHSHSNSNSNSNLHPQLYPSGPLGVGGSSMRDSAASGPMANMSPKLAPSSMNMNMPMGPGGHYAAAQQHPHQQPNVFAHGGMTESPKPLSPGQADQHRLGAHDGSFPGVGQPPRSPNIGQQVHHQNLSRNNTGRGSSPMAGLQQNLQQQGGQPGGPQLPPIHGLSHPMMPGTQQQPQPQSQNPSSNPTQQLQHPNQHQRASAGAEGQASGQGQPNMQPGQRPAPFQQPGGGGGTSAQSPDFWLMIRDMEARMQRNEAESQRQIKALQQEVHTLRAALDQQGGQSHHPQQQRQDGVEEASQAVQVAQQAQQAQQLHQGTPQPVGQGMQMHQVPQHHQQHQQAMEQSMHSQQSHGQVQQVQQVQGQ